MLTDGNDDPDLPAADASPFAVAPGSDDAQLRGWIERIVERDEAALGALYEALHGKVYGLALRIARSRELAEEITEDVFWQVWRQAPRFDAERGLAVAWVMTMTRSRALDALRRNARPEVSDDAALERAADEDGGNDPLDMLIAVADHARLHARLEEVEPLPRQLLALAFFRGMTHDEMAAHTGLPLGTVKSLVRRTLQQLRKGLEPAVLHGREAP